MLNVAAPDAALYVPCLKVVRRWWLPQDQVGLNHAPKCARDNAVRWLTVLRFMCRWLAVAAKGQLTHDLVAAQLAGGQ